MIKKRLQVFKWFVTVFLFMMIVKLFILGVVRGKEFEEAARRQRITGTSIEKDRGIIYDRNMIPITNRTVKIIACLLPDHLKNHKDAVRDVADMCNLSQSAALAAMEGVLPVFLEVDEDTKNLLTEKYGNLIPFIMTTYRYDPTSVAPHVTGYIRPSDEVGQAGIEKFYEDKISTNARKSVVSVSDAKKNPLKGFGYVLANGSKSTEPLNVKLTIDYHIQKICEDIMRERGVSGAVVVQDISNGDILAMVSSPDFDRNDVASYLNSTNNELMNKAAAPYSLGSVFKIVVAAKALEMGADYNYSSYCPGYYDVGDLRFLCHSHKRGGHGIMDMHNAMTYSCNPFFIDLGLGLGMENILEMAHRLGLGQVTGIFEQGISESSGNLPSLEWYFSPGDVANISIGQGEILATPIQIAGLLTTIANGGVYMKPNIVEGLCDDTGKIVESYKRESRTRALKVSVADKIHNMLSDVVLRGTAQGLQGYYLGGVAGKTSSAETGQYDAEGKQIVHSWFAGYFPENTHQYTIAVFIENGVGLSIPATEVFGEIARKMYDYKLVN